MSDVPRLLSRAILISWVSVGWSLVVGASAFAVAVVTRSPSLAGLGLDALIDGAASATLIWYFRTQSRDPVRAERLERATLRAIGAALLIAAAYVGTRSVMLLIEGVVPEVSALGVAISAASAVFLPAVAVVKFRLAAALPSAALRSDAVLTVGAALLAAVALVAVVLQDAGGLWWIDPAAALVIAAILAAEGVRALFVEGRGGEPSLSRGVGS